MDQFECIDVDQPNENLTLVKLLDHKIMDVERIQLLGDELSSATENCPTGAMLINMGNVQFLSSAAINKLIVLEKRTKSAGKSLMLSDLKPEVAEIFNITNLTNFFDIRNNQEEVLGASK